MTGSTGRFTLVDVEEAERDHAPDVADNGVDLTLIRQLLAMTPGERLEMIVESSRNLAGIFESARPR